MLRHFTSRWRYAIVPWQTQNSPRAIRQEIGTKRKKTPGVKRLLVTKTEDKERCFRPRPAVFQAGRWWWLVFSADTRLRAATALQLAIFRFFFSISLKRAEQQSTVDAPPHHIPPTQPSKPLENSVAAAERDKCETTRRWRFICVFQRALLDTLGEILTDLREQRQHGNKPTSDTGASVSRRAAQHPSQCKSCAWRNYRYIFFSRIYLFILLLHWLFVVRTDSIAASSPLWCPAESLRF